MSNLGKSKPLSSQSKEIIQNVIDYMTAEARNGTFLTEPKKILERVSNATKKSIRTLKRVKSEAKHRGNTSFVSPRKKLKMPKKITGLDSFDTGAIRRVVQNFYITERCFPTLRKILIKLKKEGLFHGGKDSLRKVLHSIGFKWQKMKSNRSALVEKHDIQYKRFKFLRDMNKFREEGRPIVYMDETYIHSSHTHSKGWSQTKENDQDLKVPYSKGTRAIIVHAGGEMGFIPGCLAMWKSTSTTGDYHKDMNFQNYSKWIQEKLMPNLPEKSVLVVDNASYHNVQVDRAPSSSAKKEDMQKWLTNHNIPFRADMLKIELLEIVRQNKDRYIRYAVDDILAEQEHTILRLPPYHPELNSIELIWAELKNWVALHNTTFNLNDVMELCRKKFSLIGLAEWQKICSHTKKVEEQYHTVQGVVENMVESFVINVVSGSDNSSSDNETSDDDEKEEEEDNYDNNQSGFESMEETAE